MPDIQIFADLDKACSSQVNAIVASPAFENEKIRIMPDAHSGKNSVVGFTSTVSDKAIVNIVGGDIGCGVLAVRLKKIKKGLEFSKLDKIIRSEVPSGTGNIHRSPIASFDYEAFHCWDTLPNKHTIPNCLGTLGAGNHFIELDRDEHGDIWLIVHTGSRNLGTKIAEFYQNIAASRVGVDIPDDIPHALAYLEGDNLARYLDDQAHATAFACENRAQIVKTIMKAYGMKEADRIESIHNYIDTEDMIIRKGAIAAKNGQDLVIPLNMAEGCVLGQGKGNNEWNVSAPHGTGRSKTRKDARETIAMSEYKKAMDGVWSSCIAQDTVDESPLAYKNSDDVLALAEDALTITARLSAIYNFKAPTKLD